MTGPWCRSNLLNPELDERTHMQTLRDVLKQAEENHVAIGHFNVADLVLLKAVFDAAKAGFDSIVFDLSALPFEENMRQTKEGVETLKKINPAILIEGEIGDIGTGSEIHEKALDVSRGLTTP